MKLYRTIFLTLACACILSSCAKDLTYSNFDLQRRIREAWLRINYPDLTADEYGIYRLNVVPGNGTKPKDSAYIFFNMSQKDLEGTYISTGDSELAKKLRTYNDSLRYVPTIVRLNDYQLYDAIEDVFRDMTAGSKFTILVPPEKSIVSYPKEYLRTYGLTNTNQSNTNDIFEFEFVKHVDDIIEYQIDLLQKYGKEHYPVQFPGRVDSTSYGFYFAKLKTNYNPDDTIPQGTVLRVEYIGKFLDDYCFDTNIQDSAKYYRKYNPDKEYERMDVSFYSDPSQVVEASSVVRGFANIISRMNYDEVAVGFFISDLGYGSDGNGDIPGYEPLFFYIRTNKQGDDT